MTSDVMAGSESEPEQWTEIYTESQGTRRREQCFRNGPRMSRLMSIMGAADERLSKEAAMTYSMLIVTMLCMWITAGYAETGFDPRYERGYNIFNPATQYQADNPLNPANAYDPSSAFNPVNRYDPGNPQNPVNQYSPINPFNPVNRYHPDNPLNPANKYNPDVPFAPLDGGKGRRKN